MKTYIPKESILNILQTKTNNRSISFPEYIGFNIKNNTLYMEMIETKRGNDKVVNSVCDDNMQADNAAFEGWAICIKAWLPEMVDRVCLKWKSPSSNYSPHYNRFLYRVVRFRETYDWFIIDNDLNAIVAEFENKLTSLTNNFGNKEPSKPNSKGEKYLEYMIVHDHSFEFQKKFEVEYFNHQLPVGVKRNGRSFFTGRGSAIDLWGLNGDTISIFELKYKHKMVGIITELFLYTCIIKDMVRGVISPPNSANCKRECEKKLYSKIKSIKIIQANMLSEKEYYHDLINKEVIDLLNLQKEELTTPKIIYSKYETPEKWLNF